MSNSCPQRKHEFQHLSNLGTLIKPTYSYYDDCGGAALKKHVLACMVSLVSKGGLRIPTLV